MLLRDHHETRQQLIAIIAMPALAWARDILRAVWDCFTYVAFFWWKKLYEILNTKTQRQLLEETLERAQVYEEWEGAALHLDAATGNQLWRESPQSKDYDCNLIHVRIGRIEQALEEEDLDSILRVLRNGLVRNIGNITIPKLYNRAYAGTKVLIEDYVTRVAETVKWVAEYPAGPSTGLTGQQKLEVLHDARLAFGRSCLVLQGGSIFGLCHIGVVKALHARGLLPRIISGTATGALMAALVGVHSQEELPKFLSGEGIDLSAFTDASEDASEDAQYFSYGWFATLARRVQRFLNYGYVLDIKVLEECVRDNVGDLTFDEAYQRSKKILNITITASGSGVPSLLNYLTAPNVLVWSAAMASNASDARSSPVKLLCKTSSGEIRPWIVSKEYSYRPKKRVMSSPSTEYDRDTPLSRVAEQFNVNHFIISQARPYIAPFLAPSLDHSNSWRTSKQPIMTGVMHLLMLEVQHRLSQMDTLGLLSPGLRRLLLDERVPAASWTLVPQVRLADFARLLRNPNRQEVDYWIQKGERSVWPAVCALRVRYCIEAELDQAYQVVRRRKPFDAMPVEPHQLPKFASQAPGFEEQRKRKRPRAVSMGAEDFRDL
ncbi:hypothetical protein D0860_04336 [Hortaea werneckii]|uniref:PNPLA domain-containing protein n=1 Tax=Hortaea werneckii TaxID=91943 RepID=A0A3M7H7M4_HORWE|nr:hypothetical protein D0860_04336 [Hortaea werneckii]